MHHYLGMYGITVHLESHCFESFMLLMLLCVFISTLYAALFILNGFG